MCERSDFDSLYRNSWSALRAVAVSRLKSPSDAEDAVADVFTLAWKKRGEGQHVLTNAWLHGTLRNVIGNQFRRNSRAARALESTALINRPPPADRWEAHIALVAAMRRLPLDDRSLLWMTYWEGRTGAEISQMLRCTPGAVRLRLLRARVKLAGLMREEI